MSVGGNDVGFGSIVNDYIFRFRGIFSGDCNLGLVNSQNAIDTAL